MTLAIVVLLIVSIALPLVFAWQVWRLDAPSRAAWLVSVAEKVAFVVLIVLVGRWDIAGMWTRHVLAAIFAVAVVVSWRRHAKHPWRTRQESRRLTGIVSLAIYIALLAYVATGMMRDTASRELSFPLRGGAFVIAQGGGNPLLNHHSSHPAQRHAADITAVGPLGFRAFGILPDEPSRYRVHGADVVSPCAGEVRQVVDGLPDLSPPMRDPENPAGNHILIACGEIEVTLAHLTPGSPAVSPSDAVAEGQHIAEVGNSGNSTEPHLHIHAVDPATGTGVPLAFDGRRPIRNRIYSR